MIATTIRAKEFPAKPDEGFFQGLSALSDELKHNVPGFAQAYFMRSRDGGAVVMVLWESERVLDEVLQSDIGKYAREFYERYLAAGAETAETLDVTWVAVYADEYSELAKRRRVDDPEKERRRG